MKSTKDRHMKRNLLYTRKYIVNFDFKNITLINLQINEFYRKF